MYLFPVICKRIFDILGALFLLAILWPLLAGIALAIRVQMGSPIFFRQWRPGYLGVPFLLIKFRTMRQATSVQNAVVANDGNRLTPMGRFLRRASLDELPELWNILKGDMSFVGPRPLLMQYLERYTPEQSRRHNVLPGLTGWAQVHGRNAQTWEQRFAYDLWYVEHRSFRIDLRILWLTVKQVLSGNGISAEGESTMNEFKGNQP